MKPLDADDAIRIGLAVTNIVASMQLLGHSNPQHTLMYRHGENDEWTQFAEDFATVCNKGRKGAPLAYERLVEFANSRDMMRVHMRAMSAAIVDGAA